MAHVIGFVGLSNSGKTTLICKLIPILSSKGLRVGVIKHDAHGHYKEAEHSDSASFINSGAEVIMLSGKKQVVRFEVPIIEPTIEQLIMTMPELDLILVEGYKKSPLPQIAVFRSVEQSTILAEMQGELLAVVAGCSYQHHNMEIPVYEINDSIGVAEFICEWMKKVYN
jgi:molybdopterin-guanine dinucleotide biosynthesis protein B